MYTLSTFLISLVTMFSSCSQKGSGTLPETGNETIPNDTIEALPTVQTPDGYQLVWREEFNDKPLAGNKPAMPSLDKWTYETGNHGWGSNEIQNYIPGTANVIETCAVVKDGCLSIVLKQAGSEVLSIRLNSKDTWTYGYFEARLKLPTGKGTWPAFWMLPENFNTWPDDGEIDIMEEVGYEPGMIHGSIHCKSYNHVIGTQKTATTLIPDAEQTFHVYAMEWTPEYIKNYVDGQLYFTYLNDKLNNKDTWPFNKPFRILLNLAWGGDWGGANGIDESSLPTSYDIDYIRVFKMN